MLLSRRGKRTQIGDPLGGVSSALGYFSCFAFLIVAKIENKSRSLNSGGNCISLLMNFVVSVLFIFFFAISLVSLQCDETNL